jgi:hypothetical protein
MGGVEGRYFKGIFLPAEVSRRASSIKRQTLRVASGN